MLVSAVPPTPAQVAEIERRYTPPRWGGRAAQTLESYRRTYWPDPADPDVIDGQYTSFLPPGIVVVATAREAGVIMDGGCAVVNVRYRLAAGELTARCGGR